MGVLIYIVIGIIWGALTAAQERSNDMKNVKLTFFINAVGWPISMLIEVAKRL